jgi:hypothetical protein
MVAALASFSTASQLESPGKCTPGLGVALSSGGRGAIGPSPRSHDKPALRQTARASCPQPHTRKHTHTPCTRLGAETDAMAAGNSEVDALQMGHTRLQPSLWPLYCPPPPHTHRPSPLARLPRHVNIPRAIISCREEWESRRCWAEGASADFFSPTPTSHRRRPSHRTRDRRSKQRRRAPHLLARRGLQAVGLGPERVRRAAAQRQRRVQGAGGAVGRRAGWPERQQHRVNPGRQHWGRRWPGRHLYVGQRPGPSPPSHHPLQRARYSLRVPLPSLPSAAVTSALQLVRAEPGGGGDNLPCFLRLHAAAHSLLRGEPL